MKELYGNEAAGRLLSALSRLFTAYLQMIGFTCGISDLLLTRAAESERSRLLYGAERVAVQASSAFVGEEEAGAAPREADAMVRMFILFMDCSFQQSVRMLACSEMYYLHLFQ